MSVSFQNQVGRADFRRYPRVEPSDLAHGLPASNIRGAVQRSRRCPRGRLRRTCTILFGGRAASNRLARQLRSAGAGRGSLIGLCLNRSERPIIAILACLKAGAAYVPIDPTHPDDRVRYIMEEAEVPSHG